MERFIIDTDPGVDDAHAIMMALAHPGARVEALLTVAGNVGLDRTTANALTILDVMQADVPVYAGCASALVAPPDEDAAHVHGADGLGGAGAPSERQVESEHASAALVRLANESPGEYTLVTIGPLTNVAVALKLDPDLPGKIKRLVTMGGAVNSRGNTRNLTAEFNVFADPEAAAVVFGAWPEFDLISWEATMAHGFPGDVLKGWWQLGNPRADFFRSCSEATYEFITSVLKRDMMFAADGLAMAVALEPDIVTKAEKHFLTVETAGKYTRGQTSVDWLDMSRQPAQANVIVEVDRERLRGLLELALS